MSAATYLASALLLCVLCSGCQWAPKGQLTVCETQSRSLAEQSKAQLAEIENLKQHGRELENRLIQSEEELALAEQRSGLDERRLANYEQERARLEKQFPAPTD